MAKGVKRAKAEGAKILVSNGSIGNLSNRSHREQLFRILNTEVEAGVFMHQLLDLSSGHYMIGGDSPELSSTHDVLNETVFAGKSGHYQTEEVGRTLAEAGLGGSGFLRILGRTLSLATEYELTKLDIRFSAWGSTIEAEGATDTSVVDAMDFLEEQIGNLELSKGFSESNTESYGFDVANGDKVAFVIVSNHSERSDPDAPDEVAGERTTTTVDFIQFDCAILSAEIYHVGAGGIQKLEDLRIDSESLRFTREVENKETLFAKVKCI